MSGQFPVLPVFADRIACRKESRVVGGRLSRWLGLEMGVVIPSSDGSLVVSIANDPPRRPSPAFRPRIVLAAFRHKSRIAFQSLPVGLLSFAVRIDLNASESQSS